MSDSNTPRRKVGALSTEEIVYIRENYETSSPAQIAEHLNRTETVIDKYLKNNLLTGEAKEILAIRANLKKKPFWEELAESLTAKELRYFENTWVEMVTQFAEDVLTTEELQIKQYITFDILLNRTMKDVKKYMEECDRLETEIIVQKKLADNGDADAKNLADMLDGQLSQVRSCITAYAGTQAKYSEKMSALMKELKGTRDQRLERIKDGKATWIGLIRDLDNMMTRQAEGREMELMRKAMDKSVQELMQEHQYEDKKFDRPFLNNESVLSDDEDIEDESEEV